MTKPLATKTHYVGYATGLAATVVGLFGHNLSLGGGQSTISIAAGLGTVAATIAFKLLADMGVSKSTVEADIAKAKQILEGYDALKPVLDQLPLFKQLNDEVAKVETELATTENHVLATVDAKLLALKADLEGEINKLPAVDKQLVQQILADLLKQVQVAPPAA